ncbi:hypothetical protein IJI86_00630 [Candidatus Saccharibacteria bacterium]|nr:hypothetical protein [Candidatus Saccharibacteria bacterium]
MRKIKYILYIVAILGIFLAFSGNSVVASENITTDVNVEPSLTVTIPSGPLNLNLDPSSVTSGSNNLTITVGTNNATGYKTIMTSQSGNTDLVETTDNTLTIPTLASGGYTSPSDFPANYWGYKQDSGNYQPFAINTTILESDTYANDDTTTLSFGTKIDYLQASGTYKTTLVFTTTANPLVDYIQDFTLNMCKTLASNDDYKVVDKRDDNDYMVRYINGNCWMTQNLRYIGDTGSASGSIVMKAATSNISVDTTISYDDLTSASYDAAKIHDSGSIATGIYYNYAAISAMTITGSSNSANATHDICPNSWRLPTYAEISGLSGYSSLFKPITTGYYLTGVGDPGYGYWWSATAYNASYRYFLSWYNNALSTGTTGMRQRGVTARCILNDTRSISDITTMQEISSQIVAKMTNGDTTTLTDSRDGQIYNVTKIDDKLYMTRNLAIGCDGTGSSYGANVVATRLVQDTSNLNSDFITPTTAWEFTYDNPVQVCSDTYGAYYNYAAASAGTVVGSASNTVESTVDICPAGWRLPTRLEAAGLTNDTATFNYVIGGGYYGNQYQGETDGHKFARWWTSTAGAATTRWVLYYGPGTVANVRDSGYYVRCVAK